MKKLRAILRLIEPGVAPTTMKAIQRGVRALKKAFAMSRDQHVLHALFIELSDVEDTCHKACLSPENGDGTDGLPGPEQLRKLKATARALTQRLQTMTLRSLAWDDVARAYAHRYKKARQWFRRCKHKPSADHLHRWRTPVKDHYFQSLLVLRDRPHCEATRKLGSLLGKMHDLAMLREHYDNGSSRSLVRSINQQMKNLRARIFRKSRHLFAPTPKKIEQQVSAEA